MRIQYKFWLDIEKPIEHELANRCEQLKDDRKFVSTIRDGLRLILDLRAGNIGVLLELAPWIATRLVVPTQAYTTIEPVQPKDIPLGFHVGNNSLDGLNLDIDASEVNPNKQNSTQRLIDTMIDGW